MTMPAAGARRKKGPRRQAVTPLKAGAGGTTMTAKNNHPSASTLSHDLCASWRTTMKQMIASSLDLNEKLAQEMLGWHEKATAWAKDTPWASLIKTQITSASKVLEDSTSMARKLWQIETAGESSEEQQEVQA
jgi:hypothetical protein